MKLIVCDPFLVLLQFRYILLLMALDTDRPLQSDFLAKYRGNKICDNAARDDLPLLLYYLKE